MFSTTQLTRCDCGPRRCWCWLLVLTCIALAPPDACLQTCNGRRSLALAASARGRGSSLRVRAKRPPPSAAAPLPDPDRPAEGPEEQRRISKEEWLRRRQAIKDSKCPVNCTMYGTCNEELGRCDCPRHRDGPNCLDKVTGVALRERCVQQGYDSVKECLSRDQSCVNACNHRGACVGGFCHCAPGFYGSECSLSLGADGRPVLLAGSGYSTREKRPWVYVYELPPKLAVWGNFRRLDRGLHLYVWQRLLGSGARIADGDKADYYFIPVQQRSYGESWLVREAISHIREAHPWWNRTGGSRHVVLHTGDWGLGEVAEDVRQVGENMTWLTYWGLSVDRPQIHRWSRAFRPEKDVVIPVYISPGHFVQFGMTRSPLHPAARPRPRNASTLFFAGRICHNPRLPDASTFPRCGDDTAEAYGGGIREKFFVSHWNRSGFHVVRSEPRYGTYMSRSVYCLAPPGAGHGQRQIQALFMGCVPVSVADGVAEPFEPALNWGDWGVRLAEEDIPRAHEVLEGVSEQQLKEKQSRMRCAAQHMLYSTITGAVLGEDGRFDAFETMLEVLRVRAAHPDAPQERFRELDPDFAAFMECRPPPGFKWINGTVERRTPRPGGAKGGTGTGSGAATPGGIAAAAANAAAGAGGGQQMQSGEAGAGNSTGTGGPDGSGDGDGDETEGAEAEGFAGAGGSTTLPAVLGPTPGAAAPGPAPGNASSPGPGPGPGLVPGLCSHAAKDMRHRERSCYYFLRGGGYMGVPGGAMCAKGFKTKLAACPRLWG